VSGKGHPLNKSLQRTWLSRLQLMLVFVRSRFSDGWVHRLSRHAAEIPSLGG